jgi:hypothetical protein
VPDECVRPMHMTEKVCEKNESIHHILLHKDECA